jgi:YVTN family beta-propeller protein
MFGATKEDVLEFRILGQVEVRDGQRVLELHGRRERELLAYFVLHANELVATDRLIDELWGTTPPTTVLAALHVYVSRLRKLLGQNGTTLITKKPGYLLEIDPEQIDLQRFEQLLADGRRTRMQGDPAGAAQILREALSLWHGPPLADLSEVDWARREIDRLEALRLGAVEERVEAELELGGHADLVPELEALVAKHPLRERLRGQLILALYRCGRHGEALQTYAEARRALAQELGLEPSAALRRLEQAILVQDPWLELPDTAQLDLSAARPQRRFTRRRVAGLGIAALLIAAGAAALLAYGGNAPKAAVSVAPNSVAVIDGATNKVVADVPLHARPGGIAAGPQAVWVTDFDDGTLVRVDPARARITHIIGVGPKPVVVAAGAGRVWIANSERLVAVDPRYDHVVAETPLAQKIRGFSQADLGYGHSAAVATGGAGIWDAHTVSALSKIDPATGAVLSSTALEDAPTSVAVGMDTVWVTASATSRLIGIDAATGSVSSSIEVPDMSPTSEPPNGGTGVALGYGSVWVPTYSGVRRIDQITGGTTATIPTGAGAAGVAVGGGSVWIANYLAGTVSRIDPVTDRVVATIRIGNNPSALAFGHGRVWVTVY